MILRTTPFIKYLIVLCTHLLRLSDTITAHLLDISHRAVLAHTLVAFLTFNRLIAIIGPFLPISTESEDDASQPTADSYSTRACSITWLVRCSTRSCASCASELTGLHVVSALCSCCGPTRCLYRLTPRPPNHQCPGRLDYVSCRVPSSQNT